MVLLAASCTSHTCVHEIGPNRLLIVSRKKDLLAKVTEMYLAKSNGLIVEG
jgi:hypothetical protein